MTKENTPQTDITSPLIDAERLIFAAELRDPSTPIDRLREIYHRSLEINSRGEDTAAQPISVEDLSDDQINFLLLNKSTPLEVLREINRVVRDRESDNTLPPAAE